MQQRDPVAAARERARQRPARAPSATHTIVEPAGASSAVDEIAPVVQRRHPHHPTRAAEPASIDADVGGTCAGRFGATADVVRRATPSAGPRRAGRTSATRSTRSARRHRRGGPSETTASDRQQRASSTSGVDVVGDDPPAHAPAVQRHAHDRADAHARGERVGNEIVEDALDGGDVGHDPTDPLVDDVWLMRRPPGGARRRSCRRSPT